MSTAEKKESFLWLQVQHYGIHGVIMGAQKAEEEYGYTLEEYETYLNDPDVRAAFEEQGVVVRAVETGALTPEQIIAANSVLDLVDTRSTKKKLQDLGISTGKYAQWLKDPTFQSYIKNRAEAMLGENQHEAHLALLDRVRTGDPKAIAYFNEVTGFYKPEAAKNTNDQMIDFKNVMIQVLEIIQDEVHDRDTALRISERMRRLISARTIAGQLVTDDEGPIEMPEAVPIRELGA